MTKWTEPKLQMASQKPDAAGQVVFMTAFAALVLLASLAFVARWGSAAVEQARAQTIADSVALAAISDDPAAAPAVIRAYQTATAQPLEIEVSPQDSDLAASDAAVNDLATSGGVLVEVVFAGRTANAAASAQ